MFNKIKKLAICGIFIASLLSVNVAYAADPPAPDVVVTGGSLTIEDLAIADFTSVTLDGTTKTTEAIVADVTLIDATGTGDGWRVSLAATQFTNATAENVDINTLPLNSLELGTVTITVDTLSPDSTPITEIDITQGTIDKVTGVDILSAPINEGMGTYTISIDPMTLTLLPKDAKAGTYTSTVTMTLTSGPTA